MLSTIAMILLTTISPKYDAAVQYANSHGSYGSLVAINGKIVAEGYANGGSQERSVAIASGTKSFCGVLAAFAVQDRMFALDDKVSSTITEWKTESRKSSITIRQLLSLTSGLSGGQIGNVPSYSQSVKTELVSDPGSAFHYGPTSFQVFGELLRRKLAPRSISVEDYLRTKILEPNDIRPEFWRKDVDGNPHLPSGAHLTAREWLKFGEFVRHRFEFLSECFGGSKVKPGYGLSWWLPGQGPIGVADLRTQDYTSFMPKDTVAAIGAGGQYLVVIPSRNLVAIRLAPAGAQRRSSFDPGAWLKLLVTD